MSSANAQVINKNRVFKRWNIHHRLQHMSMFMGFILCAFTGMPIKFHTKEWAEALTSFFGGADALLAWHVFGGLVCFASGFYHLGYCAVYAIKHPDHIKKAGMLQFKRTWGTDLVAHFKYILGFSDKKPNTGRYAWKEAIDYWAVFWGMAMIGLSGLMMWLPELTMKFFPRWFIDAFRMAHTDEAVLAVVFIFTWHLYNVHFNPDFFPMHWTWWDGNMSYEIMEHEHPGELKEILASEKAMNSQKITADVTVNDDGSPLSS